MAVLTINIAAKGIFRAVGTGPADPASAGPKFNRNPQSNLKIFTTLI